MAAFLAINFLFRRPHKDHHPAVEEPDRWVLVARFATVTAYRRALQPFDVREHVVPFLSEALTDEPAAHERAITAGPDGVSEHPSLLTDR